MSFPFCWLFVRCLSRAIKFCGGKKARIQVFRNDGEGTYDLFYPKTQHTRQGRGCSVFCLVLVEKNVVFFSSCAKRAPFTQGRVCSSDFSGPPVQW